MKTETELKNIIQKSYRADELLNDPLIQEFIVSLRGDLLNRFESSELNSDSERLSAWNQAQVLNGFLDKFTKTIKDGKNAKLTLMERANEKIRRII